MAVIRNDLELSLHRLANHLECQLATILPQLLAESQTSAAQSLMCSGASMIEGLREVRDGKDGGDV
jgi:hypothetical protein